jgi:hypothetical protein
MAESLGALVFLFGLFVGQAEAGPVEVQHLIVCKSEYSLRELDALNSDLNKDEVRGTAAGGEVVIKKPFQVSAPAVVKDPYGTGGDAVCVTLSKK